MNKQTLTILFNLVWLLLLTTVIALTILFIYMGVIRVEGIKPDDWLGPTLLGLAVVIPVALYGIEKLETKIKKVCYNKNIGEKKKQNE